NDLTAEERCARLLGTAAVLSAFAGTNKRPIRLIWFQRPDGLWNADCTCGASCCGIRFTERAECERWHFERADDDRKCGHKYKPCGPRFPEEDLNNPGPFVFP